MTDRIYLGIDLGGTNIKIGICDDRGKLLHKFEGPTHAESGSDAVIQRMANYARKMVEDSAYQWDQVGGIGAGSAGFINAEAGIVKFSGNLGWHNVPFKQLLESKLNKQVMIENDANVAALGEAWAGAGVGIANQFMYTLGTGVGGGIIINGKIYRGFSGVAGEPGHIAIVPDLEAISCTCGQKGCLETVSSATGIIHMAKDAVERRDETSLSLLENFKAREVFDAAKAGDDVAVRIVKRAAYYLGRSMATIAVILNPQRFILGGGVSEAGEILLQPIREVFKKYTPAPTQEGVEIVQAVLGNDAGIIGAAGLNLHN